MNICLGFEFARVLSWLTALQKCKNVKILTRKLDTRGKIQYLALILFRWGLWVLNFKLTHRATRGDLCDTQQRFSACWLSHFWYFIIICALESESQGSLGRFNFGTLNIVLLLSALAAWLFRFECTNGFKMWQPPCWKSLLWLTYKQLDTIQAVSWAAPKTSS